ELAVGLELDDVGGPQGVGLRPLERLRELGGDVVEQRVLRRDEVGRLLPLHEVLGRGGGQVRAEDPVLVAHADQGRVVGLGVDEDGRWRVGRGGWGRAGRSGGGGGQRQGQAGGGECGDAA